MVFIENKFFPQLNDEQLRNNALILNGGVNKIELNKAITKQIELEKKQEKSFLINAIKDIDEKIILTEKQIVFYENKINNIDDDISKNRYEKAIIELNNAIFSYEQEKVAYKEELATI